MAFVNPNDPNAQNAQGQTPPNQQAPISSGGAGVSGASKPQNTPGVNVPAQPSAQLSAYLAANQPQAAAFGQNVAQDVGAQINAAGAAIQPAVNTYTGNLYSVPTDAAVNSAVAASPSSLSADQGSIYTKELGAAAAAPNSADTFETTAGYGDVSGKIQKAVEQAGLWNQGNSVSSLTAALSPYETANATAGDRTLDSLLLSRTPGAYDAISAATAPAAGFQGQLDAGTKTANDALTAAIGQDTATSSAANDAARQYVGGLNTRLSDYMTKAQGDVNAYNSQVNGLSSQEAALQPNISSLKNAIDAYNALLQYGQTGPASLLKPIDYTDPGNLPATVSQPGIEQLASSKDYSDLSSLASYLGQGGLEALAPSVLPASASRAGTYTPPAGNVGQMIGEILSPTVGGVNSGLIANEDPFNKYGDIFITPSGGAPAPSGGPSASGLTGGDLAAPFVDPGGTFGDIMGGGGSWTPPPSYNARTYYSAVQDALKALVSSEQGISPVGQPPVGAVPGTPEYSAWLQQQYPGLSPVGLLPPAVDPSGNVIHRAI